MTLSTTLRNGNKALALKLMIEELGEDPLYHEFDITVPPYSDQIYPTTWKSLKDSYLVSTAELINSPFRSLTGAGWLEGLRMTGQVNKELQAKAGRVMRALKDCLQGRKESAYAPVSSIAIAADVSEGFVFNLIESRFIENILTAKVVTGKIIQRHSLSFQLILTTRYISNRQPTSMVRSTVKAPRPRTITKFKLGNALCVIEWSGNQVHHERRK